MFPNIDQAEVITALVIAAISWAAGIPQKLGNFVFAIFKKRKLKKKLASGLYDDETIESAVRFYVRPKYASVDPAEYQEPADSLLNARADLFSAMDAFLKRVTADSRYLFVLADSGMGKTSFLLNYFNYTYSRLVVRRRKMLLVSLSWGDPELLVRQISQVDRKETNLLLDAFDEDTSAIGRAHERLQEILEFTKGFRTVTVSCRTQFFLSDESIPVDTGVPKIGVVPLGTSKQYRFTKMYIAPFDEAQVREYLRKRFPGVWQVRARARALNIVRQVPNLSVRPMLLAHIPEIIRTSRQVKNAVEVYDAMVAAWAERESPWIEPHALLQLSKYLAKDFYVNRVERGGEFAEPAEIIRIARALGLKEVDQQITSRSLLNRTQTGKFKFAHRSILEYFLSDWILNDGNGAGVEITDQMAKFIAQRINCSSTSVDTFLTSCSIEVAMEGPTLTLGHPTNFSLFRKMVASIETKRLLEIRAHASGNFKASILGKVLYAFSSASPYADEKRLSQVRMVCGGIDKSDATCDLFVTAWFGGIAISKKVVVASLDLKACVIDGDELITSEFVISAVAPIHLNTLASFDWMILKRSQVVSTERMRAGDLSAMHSNKSVAFEYNRSTNQLVIRVIQGALNTAGPLLEFGILSTASVVEERDDVFVIKPIRLDTQTLLA